VSLIIELLIYLFHTQVEQYQHEGSVGDHTSIRNKVMSYFISRYKFYLTSQQFCKIKLDLKYNS